MGGSSPVDANPVNRMSFHLGTAYLGNYDTWHSLYPFPLYLASLAAISVEYD